MFLAIALILLVVLVIYQISKASEYVSVIRGEEASFKSRNKVNGFMMVAFLVGGLIACYYCNKWIYPKTNFQYGSSSVEGQDVDDLLWITILITGIVFFITQILLFGFAYKFRYKEGRKAYFFPHSSKLEIVWTVIPTLTLVVLVTMGLRSWYKFTGDAPANAMQVEVTGKQFSWIFRYPGKDGVFGKKYFKYIDEAAGNPLGEIWHDSAALGAKTDPANFDDIVTQGTMYLIKGKPVKLLIASRDVIHDVGLPQFRMKMDAVPGTPTTLWFTPKYTTEEMKTRTNNPNFTYELSCDQLCGNGHYSMKATIIVVTQAEFDAWMAKQKPAYYTAFPSKDPSNTTTPAAIDSSKTAVAVK